MTAKEPEKLHAPSFFTGVVSCLLLFAVIGMAWQIKAASQEIPPLIEVSGIKVYVSENNEKTLVTLGKWIEQLPIAVEVWDFIGAELGLWEEGEEAERLVGTKLVIYPEPWIEPISRRKVAGTARAHGVEVAATDNLWEGALGREWALMRCPMFGDEDYESCLTGDHMELISLWKLELSRGMSE